MNLSAHETSGGEVRRVRSREPKPVCSSARSEEGRHVWRYFGSFPALNLKAHKECINCTAQGGYDD